MTLARRRVSAPHGGVNGSVRRLAPLAVAFGVFACAPAYNKSAAPPAYSVDKSGPDWVATFNEGGTVRVHLKCDSGEQSFISAAVHAGSPVHIKPGQWLEWVAAKFLSVTVTPLPDLRNC
jgi:hypothetical protein